MRKKKNFMTELAKAETTFNENARKTETELQEKQHLEVMKVSLGFLLCKAETNMEARRCFSSFFNFF